MLIKEKYELDICIDCVYYNEYGNIGHNLLDKCRNTLGYTCETCVAVRKGFTKLGEEHGSYDIASNQDDPFFSLLRCEICARKKGGERHEVIAVITSIRNKQIGRKK